jgi:hypothetical protein
VSNRGTTRQLIELYPAGASIAEGRFHFAEGRDGNELASWINLDRDQVDLEPQGEARVRVTITVPPHAAAGERYAVIWASAGSAGPQPTANVQHVQRAGIRTYLDIGLGGEPPTDFSVGELVPARDKRGEPSVTIKVTNTGGRAVDITGSVELSDGPAGMRAGPFEVVQGTTLAPGHSGSVLVRLPVELPNGPWKIRVTLESGLAEQTAEGDVTFPDPGEVGEPTLLFVRLGAPWSAAGWSLVVGLTVLVGLFLVARRTRGRHRPCPNPPAGRSGPLPQRLRWRRG